MLFLSKWTDVNSLKIGVNFSAETRNIEKWIVEEK